MYEFGLLAQYKDYVEKRQGRKIVLFDAGANTPVIIERYFPYDEVAAIWDTNPAKHGLKVYNIQITDPLEDVKKFPPDTFVVIITPNSYFHIFEMYELLKNLGVQNIFTSSVLALCNTYWRYTSTFEYNFHELNTFPLCSKASADIGKVRQMLCDEKSKFIYDKMVEKLKYNVNYYSDICDGTDKEDSYFSELFEYGDEEVLIDGGAFDATDTARFMSILGEKFKKAYVFEPDDNNYIRACTNLCKYCNGDIQKNTGQALIEEKFAVYKCGLLDRNISLQMVRWGNYGSRLSNPDGSIHASEVGFNLGGIEVVKLDDLIDEKDRATMIKLDVEGSELAALKGAEKTIRECKPKLAICIYHQVEDLWTIPLYLKELVPEYRFYVRHFSGGLGDKILYATL